MSVVRSSFGLENFHIFYLEPRKHLQYAAIHSNSTTKLKRISETNNTLAGHCSSGEKIDGLTWPQKRHGFSCGTILGI